LFGCCPLPSTRVHEIPTYFFLCLLSRDFYPRVAVVPTSNYSHDFFVDTPRSRRYIAYLRYAAVFVLAEQVLLLCGGHQKVINGVGAALSLSNAHCQPTSMSTNMALGKSLTFVQRGRYPSRGHRVSDVTWLSKQRTVKISSRWPPNGYGYGMLHPT
jgi:hypothetical protein